MMTHNDLNAPLVEVTPALSDAELETAMRTCCASERARARRLLDAEAATPMVMLSVAAYDKLTKAAAFSALGKLTSTENRQPRGIRLH